MQVTVQSTYYSGGQMGYGKGVDEQGEVVYFSDDWRPIRNIQRALDAKQTVQVDLDDWQIITFEQYMAVQATAVTNVGPFQEVTFDKMRTCGSKHYRIVVYGAYNACGLIGHEDNGVGILCEEDRQVVAGEIGCDPNSNPASKPRQFEIAETILALPDADFVAFVNDYKGSRYKISL